MPDGIKIRFLQTIRGHNAGDVSILSYSVGRDFIERGIAEFVPDEIPQPKVGQ